jgi:hypothetical protein
VLKTPENTATAAAAATSTPTTAASVTPTPTLPATPVLPSPTLAAPTATVRYPDGRRFIFFYDQTAFYLLQVDGEVGPVSYLTFERLNDKDKPAITFEGSIWAKYSAITKPGWCMQVLIAGKGEYDRPPQCSDQYLSTRYLAEKDKSIFWTTPPDFEYFRVLWKKEEIARCEIKAGMCEVRLP